MNDIYQAQTGLRANITKALGVIIGVTGMLGAFLVSLLKTPEGGLSIKEKASDPWFWVVWGVVFFIAMAVVMITYKTTKKEAKEQPAFAATLKYYKEQKDIAMQHIDVLPTFCEEKNKEIYKMIEREIIESADIVYSTYSPDNYYQPIPKWKQKYFEIRHITPPTDKPYLAKWQAKRLKLIQGIKINKLRSRDLTQEYAYSKNNAYSFLPQDEKSNEKSFLKSGAVNRAINTFAFLLVGSLTFGVSGWVSAITNSLGILFAWFGAVIAANDYVNNELRNRYISKGDLLSEFNNTASKYTAPVVEQVKEEKKDDKGNNDNSARVPNILGD